MIRRIAVRFLPLPALCLALAAIVPAAAYAQETRATVTGSVTDPQGGVVPGVLVTVHNVDTNIDSTAVTEADGGFTVRQLIPGRYRITAALQGFKTFTRDGVTLRTAETATIRITLSLGGVEETVVVTSGLTQVESNETAISSPDREIANMSSIVRMSGRTSPSRV